MRRYRRNADVSTRGLQRRAAGGDPEAVQRLRHERLRAGAFRDMEDMADRHAASAIGQLAESGWVLVDRPDGFVLQRPTYPESTGWVITVSNDPVRLGYEGSAVGWHDTPLIHFRMDHPQLRGGGGVLNPHALGGGTGSPDGLVRAARFLESPRGRFLGAMTLAADEGLIPRVWIPEWHELDEQSGLPGLQDKILRSAGLKWHRSMPAAEAGNIKNQARNAITFFYDTNDDRALYPVNGFGEFEYIPFPDILRTLGFRDASWHNDAGARATLEVAGPGRHPRRGRREIEWHGNWPPIDLEDEDEEYELVVWCAGLHPIDQEFGDGVRYDVRISTKNGDGDYEEIGEARNEQALAMILQNLGLRA